MIADLQLVTNRVYNYSCALVGVFQGCISKQKIILTKSILFF